ncbi:MAG: hAT transposon family protein, partial [Pseudomonadota bacterium]
GFVTDNENKIKKLRQLLGEWRPELLIYGCSAHYLNLVENEATPSAAKNHIVEVQKYFRTHQKEAALLKEAGGKSPQLPNNTRWSSDKACFSTFVENHHLYLRIRDSEGNSMSPRIKHLIDNRGLLLEARHMLQQLDKISDALNVMQSDSSDLADATLAWMELIRDESLPEEVRRIIEKRFEEVRTPFHILAVMLRGKNIHLRKELKDEAMAHLENLNNDFPGIMAAYEMEDASMFPKAAFQNSVKNVLAPIKYWGWITQNAEIPLVKHFCSLAVKILSCPPSTGGLERCFSAFGMVHSKLRNRLNNERVAKLVKVYLHLRSGNEAVDNFDLVMDKE